MWSHKLLGFVRYASQHTIAFIRSILGISRPKPPGGITRPERGALVFLFLILCSVAALGQLSQITASKIVDGGGKPLRSGEIDFYPTTLAGYPIQPQLGGGGVILYKPAQCLVVNGAITTATEGSACTTADTSLSNQANFCYKTIVKDTTTIPSHLLPPMKCLQPRGATWNLDTQYIPDMQPGELLAVGPPGPQGPAGPGANYTFPGAFSVNNGAVTWTAQGANTVMAGPGTGSTPGTPGFRYLNSADVAQAGPLTNALPNINGEIWVDGTRYATMNAAWLAAEQAIQNISINQTIRVGPGFYTLAAPLVEPTNGNCISIIGTAGVTQAASSGVVAEGSVIAASIATGFPSGQDIIQLTNSGASVQAHGCVFRNFTVEGAGSATPHGFTLQWFRGLDIENVAVKDTGSDGFLLGEASGSHQSLGYFRNLVVSWDATKFTPAGRGNYGVNAQTTLIDSDFDNLYVRNAKQAAVYDAGGGNVFNLIHGFGYPYSCATAPCNNSETSSNAADASYATNYEVVDAGSGGNMYFNAYMDSPAIAAFDLKSNGVQINGGHIQWPDNTSFPNATFAEVESTVTSNLVISNVDCLNMSTTAGIPGSPAGASGVWISYMGSAGTAPAYSSVSNLAGCGNYVQQRIAARQTAFDANGNNSANTNFGAGNPGVTPKVFVTPLSTSGAEGGVEVENFSGGQADTYYSGYSGQPSNFAVMADGAIKSTGLQTGVTAITASTTLTKANHVILANAAGGAFTLTLPSCFTAMPDGLAPTGMEFTIVKTDVSGNAVTLTTTSGQSINVRGTSYTSLALPVPSGLTLACGTDNNWYGTEQVGGIRATWTGYVGSQTYASANTDIGANTWKPTSALQFTRFDIHTGVAPSGCTTYPVVGLYDATMSAWLGTVTLASGAYADYSAISGAANAGDTIRVGVSTAASGCTVSGAALWWTAEYVMR